MPAPTNTVVPVDYDKYLSWESKNRQRSQLKQLHHYAGRPEFISFAGGLPSPSTWPVNGIVFSVPFAGKSVFVPGFGNEDPSGILPLAEYTPPLKTEPLRPNLTTELQYSSGYGQPHWIQWLREHVDRTHHIPYDDWQVHSTAGNTDGIDGIFRACLDRGDHLLVEEFAFPGMLSSAQSQGLKPIGVDLDGDGVRADALDALLTNWDETQRGGPRPKFILIVSTCSNPSGSTMPVYRKREVYEVARKWGLVIIEDDPYCFLQIREKGKDTPIVPTFLSLDVDGRVIRVDSFSKIFAPGARAGFVTGPTPLVQKIMNSREQTTQATSGFSVAAISSVIRAWGSHEGFEQDYLPHISKIYSDRSQLMVDLLNKYVSPDKAEVPPPSGGMFLWVRIRAENHPAFPKATPEEISDFVNEAALANHVLPVQSRYFKAPGGIKHADEEKRIFLRLSFANPTPDVMEEGVKRLAKAFDDAWERT